MGPSSHGHMGKGHLLHLAGYCDTEGMKCQVREGWLEPRHQSEDQAEHRSQGVKARAGTQEGRKLKTVKQWNEPEAAVGKCRNKDGICPPRGLFKYFFCHLERIFMEDCWKGHRKIGGIKMSLFFEEKRPSQHQVSPENYYFARMGLFPLTCLVWVWELLFIYSLCKHYWIEVK